MINYINELNQSIWVYPNPEMDVNFIISKDIPAGFDYRIVIDEFEDMNFIGAYTADFTTSTGSISPIIENIEKAKDIFIERMRYVRTPILKDLDVHYMRSLEIGDTVKTQEIVTKKQQLRDVTDIDTNSATTIAELKSLWPENILGKSPFS